jgi:hypothetical protein
MGPCRFCVHESREERHSQYMAEGASCNFATPASKVIDLVVRVCFEALVTTVAINIILQKNQGFCPTPVAAGCQLGPSSGKLRLQRINTLHECEASDLAAVYTRLLLKKASRLNRLGDMPLGWPASRRSFRYPGASIFQSRIALTPPMLSPNQNCVHGGQLGHMNWRRAVSDWSRSQFFQTHTPNGPTISC